MERTPAAQIPAPARETNPEKAEFTGIFSNLENSSTRFRGATVSREPVSIPEVRVAQ